MLIKNRRMLSHKKSNLLWLSIAIFSVGIHFEEVHHVQRSFPIQNQAKLRPNCTGGFIEKNWENSVWLKSYFMVCASSIHAPSNRFRADRSIRLSQINPARSVQSPNSRVNSEDGCKRRLFKKVKLALLSQFLILWGFEKLVGIVLRIRFIWRCFGTLGHHLGFKYFLESKQTVSFLPLFLPPSLSPSLPPFLHSFFPPFSLFSFLLSFLLVFVHLVVLVV